MLWLKRNLFLAIGGLVACVLLGVAIYYMLTSMQENKTVESVLEEKKEALDKISRSEPFPSKENIDLVSGEISKVREATTKMRTFFAPVAVQRVIGQDFKVLLDNTIDQLRRKADQASIGLPSPKYAFSFESQKDKLRFAPGSFPALPEQLAEIKLVTEILFDSKINKLLNIRRSPVSSDDDPRSSADYHDFKIATSPQAGTVVRPYQFEFECFSPELATALERCYRSTNGLHVKSVQVEPAAAAAVSGAAISPAMQPAVPTLNPRANLPFRRFQGAPPPVAPRPGAPPPPAGSAPPELKTALTERLLKVVLLIEVIQPGTGR